MDKQEWREGKFKLGDTWRSHIVYRCGICHTKINKWVMGGAWWGSGPRLLCPADQYKEHDELESALEKYNSLDEQIQDYEKTLQEATDLKRERAQNMINNLSAERELLEAKIKKLRELFSGRFDDVEGVDSSANIRDYYPSARYSSYEKKSLLEADKFKVKKLKFS